MRDDWRGSLGCAILPLMSFEPVLKGACYDDLRRLPPELVGEIIAGDLYTQPRPANLHAAFTSSLGMDIGSAFHRGKGGPGGWFILDGPELHLREDVVVPTLRAGVGSDWSRSRMNRFLRWHPIGCVR